MPGDRSLGLTGKGRNYLYLLFFSILFESVMSKLGHWYEDGQPKGETTVVLQPQKFVVDAKPFQKSEVRL